jgi:hypothetical protein
MAAGFEEGGDCAVNIFGGDEAIAANQACAFTNPQRRGGCSQGSRGACEDDGEVLKRALGKIEREALVAHQSKPIVSGKRHIDQRHFSAAGSAPQWEKEERLAAARTAEPRK